MSRILPALPGALALACPTGAQAKIAAGRLDDLAVPGHAHTEISRASRVEISLRFLLPPRKGAHGR